MTYTSSHPHRPSTIMMHDDQLLRFTLYKLHSPLSKKRHRAVEPDLRRHVLLVNCLRLAIPILEQQEQEHPSSSSSCHNTSETTTISSLMDSGSSCVSDTSPKSCSSSYLDREESSCLDLYSDEQSWFDSCMDSLLDSSSSSSSTICSSSCLDSPDLWLDQHDDVEEDSVITPPNSPPRSQSLCHEDCLSSSYDEHDPAQEGLWRSLELAQGLVYA